MNDQPTDILKDDFAAELTGDQQALAIAAAVALEQKLKEAPPAKPTITEKEVSWQQAVAAAMARREHEQKGAADSADILAILALPRVEKVKVGGFELEPYNLGHEALLEQLNHPYWSGGVKPTNDDLAVAVLIFSQRELLEHLVSLYGGERTNALIRNGPALRNLRAAITRDAVETLTPWLARQFRLVQVAQGETATEKGEPQPGK